MPIAMEVYCASAHAAARAQAVAQTLGINVHCVAEATSTGWRLVATAQRLELHAGGDGRVRPLSIDLAATPAPRMRGAQLLLRAVGANNHSVVDASAGWGQDAATLASRHAVIALERSPVVAALLQDALLRVANGGPAPFRLLFGDARVLLPQLPRPDAVYIDTMFSAKRKRSAAVRKEMQLLRAVVGDDPDAGDLLAIARDCARDRVVVKRADDAPPLADAPDFCYRGKLVRYDVYRPRNHV